MKKIVTIFIFALWFLVIGCASLTYESPEGTKVTYKRFMTGADVIKGQTGEAKIETHGQKSIDPALMEIIVKSLGGLP